MDAVALAAFVICSAVAVYFLLKPSHGVRGKTTKEEGTMSKQQKDDVFAPHITDPDAPMPLMTAEESERAAAKIAEMFPELVMLPGKSK